MIPRKVRAVYDSIPKVNCQRCGACCGPVEMSSIEKRIVREYCKHHNIDLKDMFSPLVPRLVKAMFGDYHCPMFVEKQCLIYEVRPLICRLQGVTARLPCPNNKTDLYPLSEKKSAEMLRYLELVRVRY